MNAMLRRPSSGFRRAYVVLMTYTPPEFPEAGCILRFACRVDNYDVNYDVANDRGLMYHYFGKKWLVYMVNVTRMASSRSVCGNLPTTCQMQLQLLTHSALKILAHFEYRIKLYRLYVRPCMNLKHH